MLALLASLHSAGADQAIGNWRPPPCVDVVLLGVNRTTGNTVDAWLKDDLLGHSWYSLQFVPERALVGELPPRPIKHWLIAHALATVNAPSIGFFQVTKHGLQVVDTDRIVEDMDGRPFVMYSPAWEIEHDWLSWRPRKPSRFQRRMVLDGKRLLTGGFARYYVEAIREGGNDQFELLENDGLATTGIYLDDLMTMFFETRGRPCDRWTGRLAMWSPSR
jgi:hypothetical protein